MKKTRKTKTTKRTVVSADAIARRADSGEDIAEFFTSDGTMMPPIQ